MRKMLVSITLIVLLLTVSFCSADLSSKAMPQTLRYQTEAAGTGDADLYAQAQALYESKNFYEAYKLFVQSQYGDWEKKAQRCTRRWPSNGEVYHDYSQWLRDTQLTFRVEQPDDVAVFFKVYKDDNLMSTVFIGGNGEVTVGLPGNQTYVIKDGVGSDWFGTEITFGENGAYETMTFGEKEEPFIYLERTLDYLITVNIEDVIGEPIGTEFENWEGFQE